MATGYPQVPKLSPVTITLVSVTVLVSLVNLEICQLLGADLAEAIYEVCGFGLE